GCSWARPWSHRDRSEVDWPRPTVATAELFEEGSVPWGRIDDALCQTCPVGQPPSQGWLEHSRYAKHDDFGCGAGRLSGLADALACATIQSATSGSTVTSRSGVAAPWCCKCANRARSGSCRPSMRSRRFARATRISSALAHLTFSSLSASRGIEARTRECIPGS